MKKALVFIGGQLTEKQQKAKEIALRHYNDNEVVFLQNIPFNLEKYINDNTRLVVFECITLTTTIDSLYYFLSNNDISIIAVVDDSLFVKKLPESASFKRRFDVCDFSISDIIEIDL